VVFRNAKSLLLDKPGFGERQHLLALQAVRIRTKQQQLCAKDLGRQKAMPKSLLLFQKSPLSQRHLLTRARHLQTAEGNSLPAAMASRTALPCNALVRYSV